MVTAVNTRKLLQIPPADESQDTMHLVVNTNHGTVSLVIDKVGEVLRPEIDSFEELPETTSQNVRKYVTRVSKLEGKLLLIMDTERLGVD